MTVQRILLSTLFFMMVTMQLGASCSNTNVYHEDGGGGYYGGGGGGYGPAPGPVIVQNPGPVIVEEGPPVVIQAGRPWPRYAELKREGEGGMSWQSDESGIVYFVDGGRNYLVASVEVRRGDIVRIEPRQDHILLNNTVVVHENLNGDHRFQILFADYNGHGRGGGGGYSGGGGYPGGGGGNGGGGGGGNRGGGGNYPPPIDTTPGWPASAVRVADGENRQEWKATADGKVWVIDAGQNRMIATFGITRGQSVAVEPGNDRIILNGRTIDHQNLRREARHQILFDANGGGGGNGGGNQGGGGGSQGGGGGGNRGGGGGGGGGAIDTTPGWPNSAKVVADGENRQEFKATADGTVYIVDAGRNHLIAKFGITRGQSVAVEPGNDRILLAGRTVDHENLRREARHQILFDASGGGGGGGGNPGRGGGGRGAVDTSPGWPATAAKVADGENRQEWKATADGTVYIIDAGQNRMIAKFGITRGQSVAVEPGNDRILLAGRTVDHQNLRREARHQILFDKK